MQPVGVAIVGAGYWGPNLVRNFRAFDGSDLRWICDLSLERARQAVGSRSTVGVTDTLDDVLADPLVEAVAVATPAGTHHRITLACLDAGKHVLVEKPLAASVSEGERLVAAAERAGVVLMCDHTYCYTPAVRKLRELVRTGAIGDLHYIDSVRVNLGLVQPDVDVFWDLAPHDLSILEFILPEGCRAETVAAQAADPIGAGHPCLGYVTVGLTGGALAHIHVNWLSPVKVRTTIVGGSERIVLWDDLNPSQRLSLFDKGVHMNGRPDREVRREQLVSYRTGDMLAPALPEAEALQGVVQEFCSAIRRGHQPLTGGASGLWVLRILEALPRSIEAGGAAVPLEPAQELPAVEHALT